MLTHLFILFFPPQAWRLEALHGSLERYGTHFLHFSLNSCTQLAPHCYLMCGWGGRRLGRREEGGDCQSSSFQHGWYYLCGEAGLPLRSATQTAAEPVVPAGPASSSRVHFADWPSAAVENYTWLHQCNFSPLYMFRILQNWPQSYIDSWDLLELNWEFTV